MVVFLLLLLLLASSKSFFRRLFKNSKYDSPDSEVFSASAQENSDVMDDEQVEEKFRNAHARKMQISARTHQVNN